MSIVRAVKKTALTIIASVMYVVCFTAGLALTDEAETRGIHASEREGYKDTAASQSEPESIAVSVIKQPDYWYVRVRTESTVQSVETAEIEEAEEQPRYELTEEEQQILCYVAESEDHTSVESRQAVMQVVLNRVESEKFPDSITDVLYQPKQFAVMGGYGNDYIPSCEALEALERLLQEDIFEGECVLFFAAERVNPQRIARNLRLVKTEGGTNFYAQD